MTETPRTGDRVRVTPKPFEGEMICDGSQGRLIQVRNDEGYVHAFGPDYATVEVLAPSLCTETEGATGIRCQRPAGHTYGHEGATTEEQTKTVGYPLFVSWPADSQESARLSVRVGNTPHGLAVDVHERVVQYLADGFKDRAEIAAFNGGLNRDDAVAYVKSLTDDAKPSRYRYFTKPDHLLRRITPDGHAELRHPDSGWVAARTTVAELESEAWSETDVEPVGGAS